MGRTLGRYGIKSAAAIGVLLGALILGNSAAASSPSSWEWDAGGAGAETLTAVRWDGTQFIATTAGGAAIASTDGLNWSSVACTRGWGAVAWDGSKMVVPGQNPEASAGLKPWSEAHLEAVSGVPMLAACVGGTSENPVFVAVGESGAILRSSDGATWAIERTPAAEDLRGIAYGGAAGEKRFVAVGRNGAALVSSDGVRWAAVSTRTKDDLNAVAWCGTRFFAVGAAGTILGSGDGLAWHPEVSPVGQWLCAIAWSGTKAVAVGDYGAVAVGEATPAVTGVNPNAGPIAGGTTVVLSGSGFTGATAVTFDVTAATSYTVNSDTQITAVSPAHAAGTIDVTVTAGGVTSTTSSNDYFTYYDAPTVTAVSPSAGLTAGGTMVTITGTNFAPTGTTVMFGTVPATSVVYGSLTSITAVSPAQAAGVVHIIVTAPGGTSATSAADEFTYVAPVPVVLSMAPASGPPTGGTPVTITGVGLTAATAVHFGVVVGTAVHVLSDTTLTVVSPAHAAGPVDVTVTTAGGTSPVWAGDVFTYSTPAPTVTGLNPTSGPMAGGTTVTITGTNFSAGATVRFGAALATGVTVVSSTLISAVSPAGTAVVDVTVTTSNGTSAISAADKFTYVAAPTLAAITPSSGSVAGGTPVTLTGAGFLAGASVTVGGVPCTTVVVASSTSITAVTGAHAGGVVDVTVTNSDGQSATLPAGFTYSVPPAISSVQKAQDPFRLKIYGSNFHGNCTAYINGVPVPETKFKSGAQVNAMKGGALKAMVPKGVAVQITVKNNDDGLVSAPFTYVR